MSAEPKVAPYGTWESLITAEFVSGSTNTFNEVHVNSKTGVVYLLEGRPSEEGRVAIVKIEGGRSTDVLPEQYTARSQIHEYGGGAAAIGSDGNLIFTDANTKGVFRLKSPDDIQPIVEADEDVRFADFDVHPKDPKWVLAVQEAHKKGQVDNNIVVIDTDSKAVKIICEGADFYSHPKFSYDGKWIAWIQWKHPDMPWTGSELYVAAWENGNIGKAKYVAGKSGTESISQPKWHSYGGLIFVSDRTGFKQLYLLDVESAQVRKIETKGFEDADFSPVGWLLGDSTYAELSPGNLVLAYTRNGTSGVILVGIISGQVVDTPLGLVSIAMSSVRRLSDNSFTVVGSSIKAPQGLYLVDLKSHGKDFLRSVTSISLPTQIFSKATSISFPRTYGKDKTGLTHAIFIPPHNPSFSPAPGTKPPLIVWSHGGPTDHVSPGLDLRFQYWTSRGYAFAAVNYAGSTGYGRKYVESLNYTWGIKDVDDCASCVAYLSSQGLVDGTKVGIVGGSAGGYTVLNALTVYPSLFAAGNSRYGISNLANLATGTHKFESQYLFKLMFPEGTPEEEQKKIYWERSPCNHAEKIESPLLILQGEIDKVVPLDQSEEMERVLKERGKDVKLVVFEGEGHGFRREENVKRALEEEEGLWRRTLL